MWRVFGNGGRAKFGQSGQDYAATVFLAYLGSEGCKTYGGGNIYKERIHSTEWSLPMGRRSKIIIIVKIIIGIGMTSDGSGEL
jgi:hypothetical protein